MLVANLNEALDTLAQRAQSDGLPADVSSAIALLRQHLLRFHEMELEPFLLLLDKVKLPNPKAPRKPKRTPEEIAAEKTEKARLKAEKAARKKAAEAAKAEKARLKAEEAARKKAAAEAAKAEKARLKAEEAARKKAEKLAAAEQAKKQQEQQTNQQVKLVVTELQNLLIRFRGRDVEEEVVMNHLAMLDQFKAPQLLQVARGLNADATLTEKSPRKKIHKQISEMILRVWRASDKYS